MKKSDKQVRYQFAAGSGLFLFKLGSQLWFFIPISYFLIRRRKMKVWGSPIFKS